tara:strand:+ start:641 stop:1318 length:678 start_codon:yes stop_codon:yes gene_type:complete
MDNNSLYNNNKTGNSLTYKNNTKLDFLFSEEDFIIRNKLKVDKVALYSVTNSVDAIEMARILKQMCDERAKFKEVVDLTACVGGNTIAFCREFDNVTAIEINVRRYKLLLHNLSVLNLNNISCWNGNAMSYLSRNMLYDADVYFIDPPWGGPYAKQTTKIIFNGFEIYDWCQIMFSKKKIYKTIIVGIKVPPTYPIPKSYSNCTVRTFVHFRKMKLIVLKYYPNI